MRQSILIATILCSALSGPVLAAEPTALLDNYAAQARQQDPNFTGFQGNAARPCISAKRSAMTRT
ncbi:hypothetical protein [Pseudomonas aeruginosa]|uniref:hypothetical protein n=1 Tax=Pseudomonas aeruginosa TaxID=287 RepID=UPI0029351B3C|nr:hypothetical protein [Pseudomonas aeruginosa]